MKLILHIGLGKTGTTAFQSFCDHNYGILRENGYVYLGTRLQNVTEQKEFKNIGDVNNVDLLSNALANLDEIAQKFDEHTKAVIWSNETFSMSRTPDELIYCLEQYVSESHVFSEWEVYIVLRRQDQWIESAYKQWVLKHKTYKGTGVMSPERYAQTISYLLDYERLVKNG